MINLERIIATVHNGGAVPTGVLSAGDPPPAQSLGRCDRCSAEALVLWERDANTVALCGHHHDQHWLKLHDTGWDLADDRRGVPVS